ncbi:MAG TPA: tetratricopeptide repeat protein [Planctomycetota bacterium]|nr:tetratricopeptide repeat protein [Planctomycetota bacterium]
MRAFLSLTLAALAFFQGDADEQLRYLTGLASKGMPAELEREAQSFLREHPDHPRANEARYRLACALFEQKHTEKAADLLRPLCKQRGFEFESEALFRLSQCELDLGRPAEAVAALERTLELGKEYLALPARALHADALLAAGRIPDAERAFALVLEHAPKSEYAPDAACGLCWCAFKTRDFAAVVERSKQFLSNFSRHARAGEVQFLRAEAQLELGQSEAALQSYAKVGEGSFADAALRGAAFAQASLGRHAEAAKAFATLAERFPQSRFVAEARLQCGVERLAAGDPQGALAALDPKIVGDRGEGAFWRAKALLASGDSAGALALASRASKDEKDPALAARWTTLRADLLTAAGRPDEARAAYEAADSDYALQAGAVASLESKHPEEAVRLARKLLERNPRSPYRIEALLAAAEGMFALGQHENAEQAFLSAAESDKDLARRDKTRLRAAWCRYLRKQPGPAAAMFAELARSFKDGPQADEAAYMAGRAAEDAGDLRGARSAYERYLERFAKGERRAEALVASARLADGPEAVARLEAALKGPGAKGVANDAHFELAERLSKAGSFDEAAGHYQAVLEGNPSAELAQSSCYGLAWCQFSQEQYKKACATLEPLARQAAAGSDGIRAELAVAALELGVWSNVRAGSLDTAFADFRALQARSDNDTRVWSAARVLLGAMEGVDHASDRAQLLAQCAKSAKTPVVAAEIDAERALLALDQGQRDQALQFLDRAWRGSADSVAVREAACTIGEACGADDGDQRGQQILRALARDEKGARADRAVYQLGFWRLSAGDARGAAGELARFAQRFPESSLRVPAQFLEAEANYRAGELEKSLAQFEVLSKSELSAELAPKVLFRAGLLHCQAGRWRDGERELQQLAQDFPKFENLLEAQLWRARAQAERKDAAAARAGFEAIANADKGMLGALARLGLGELDLEAGNTQAALSSFLKISVLYSDVELAAQANWGAGRALEQSGEPQKAAASYREVIAKAPKSKLAARARERLSALEQR